MRFFRREKSSAENLGREMSTVEARRQAVSKDVGWPEIDYPDACLTQKPAVETPV
jgi:hypothetical protein